MDDFLGFIIIAGIVIGVIYLIVVYVIPAILAAAAIIIGVFAAIGSIVGFVIAIKNFVYAVMDTRTERRGLNGFESTDGRANLIKSCPDNNYSNHIFEDYGAKSYFMGPCFSDVRNIIKKAFDNNFDSSADFSRGERWYTKVLFFVWALFQVIMTYVIGTIFTFAISAVFCLLSLVFAGITFPFFGIVLLIETIIFKIKKISYRCPACKHEYDLPVYICPQCGIKHIRLKPGRYGIFKRRCVCGTVLPVTMSSKGIYKREETVMVSYSGSPVQRNFEERITLKDIESHCPKCNAEHNAGMSHPISIALIGGASAGKTTFKAAFLHDFIGEETIKYNIDYEFPSESLEKEYNECNSYFSGRPIGATNRGFDFDITTFSFFLKNKKFDTDRMIHLYDMPGEVFQSGEAKEGWNLHTFNDGAVFLLDPYTLSNVRTQNESEIKGSIMGTSVMKMDDLIASLIDTLRQVKTKTRKGKFTIPIALTINKADTAILKKQIGDEAVKTLMSEEPEIFKDYFVTMDYVCRCFLAKNEGEGFMTTLDLNFETVHFFSSSPMGFVPKAANVRFRPINVLPIMQWMMLRTDKQLGKAWTPDMPVTDLTFEQKELYRTHREYYEKYIDNVVNEVN